MYNQTFSYYTFNSTAGSLRKATYFGVALVLLLKHLLGVNKDTGGFMNTKCKSMGEGR
jgi:hypothetical protein